MRAQAPLRQVPEALHRRPLARESAPRGLVRHNVAPPVRAGLEVRHAGIVIINTAALVEEAAVDVVPGRVDEVAEERHSLASYCTPVGSGSLKAVH